MPTAGQLASDLLEELLIDIFRYCDDFDPRSDDHGYLVWLPVLHVCRRWYYIGVNCPSLWQVVVCSTRSAHFIQEVLSRSKEVPLHICILDPDRHTIRISQLVAKQAERARSLRVRGPSVFVSLIAEATRELPGPFPLLGRLDIEVTEIFDARYILRLDMFFSRDLSSLIELQVTANCNVDGMIDAPNVRSLTLTKMESRNNDRPWGFCARSVLGALRTMHYLRSLRLLGSSHFFHNLNEEQAFSTEEPVILHALRYFIMSGSLMNWRLLIPRCIFPATVRRFSLATVVNTDTTVGNIAKLTHYIFAKRDAHLWALVLTTTPAGYLIQGSFAPDEVPEPSMLPDSTDLWLHCVNGTLPEERLLTLLAKLPLAGLHALSVFGTAARDNLVPTCLRDAVFGEDVLDSAPFVRTMPGTDMEAEAEPVEWRTIFPSLKSVHWHPSP